MHYLSILQDPRAQRAILDEFFPDWRDALSDPPQWKRCLQRFTGISERASDRWFAYAKLISDAEWHLAA